MRIKIFMFNILPFLLFSQIIQNSTYTADMFPNDVDEKKILILLPTKRTMNQIDSIIPNLSPGDLYNSHEIHIKNIDRASLDINKYIEKYNFNCELIKEEDYNVNKFPVKLFPLVIYPEPVIYNGFYLTHAYRMFDFGNKIRYGYVVNYPATYDYQYFKQLYKYIKKLQKGKNGNLQNELIANRVEEKIYKKEKHKNTIKTIGFVLVGVLIFGGVFAYGVLTSN